MEVANSIKSLDNGIIPEFKVEVGHFGEGMYCINCPSTLSNEVQKTISGMLLDNQGVGILGGYFDDNLTICMISGLCIRTLGYDSPQEFLDETHSSLLNMTISDEEGVLLRNRLLSTKSDVFSYYLKGKEGKSIPVRMGYVLLNTENGKKCGIYLSAS